MVITTHLLHMSNVYNIIFDVQYYRVYLMLRSQAKGDGVFSSHPWDCQLGSNTNIEEL